MIDKQKELIGAAKAVVSNWEDDVEGCVSEVSIDALSAAIKDAEAETAGTIRDQLLSIISDYIVGFGCDCDETGNGQCAICGLHDHVSDMDVIPPPPELTGIGREELERLITDTEFNYVAGMAHSPELKDVPSRIVVVADAILARLGEGRGNASV